MATLSLLNIELLHSFSGSYVRPKPCEYFTSRHHTGNHIEKFIHSRVLYEAHVTPHLQLNVCKRLIVLDHSMSSPYSLRCFVIRASLISNSTDPCNSTAAASNSLSSATFWKPYHAANLDQPFFTYTPELRDLPARSATQGAPQTPSHAPPRVRILRERHRPAASHAVSRGTRSPARGTARRRRPPSRRSSRAL